MWQPPIVHLLYDFFYSLYWGQFCPTTKNEVQFSNIHRQVIPLFFSLSSVSLTSPHRHQPPTTDDRVGKPKNGNNVRRTNNPRQPQISSARQSPFSFTTLDQQHHLLPRHHVRSYHLRHHPHTFIFSLLSVHHPPPHHFHHPSSITVGKLRRRRGRIEGEERSSYGREKVKS